MNTDTHHYNLKEMNYTFKKITVITGEYGCGKTNLTVNTASCLSKLGSTAAVDLDTVNPYFRTADFYGSDILPDTDIICPDYACSNLDIPVINFNPEQIIRDHDFTIIDVGGSQAGARVLGKYHDIFSKYSRQTEVIYVFNMFRSLSPDPEEIVSAMRETENSGLLKCTCIANNSNLGIETSSDKIAESLDFSDRVSSLSGLPCVFTCLPDGVSAPDKNRHYFNIRRYVRTIWEK